MRDPTLQELEDEGLLTWEQAEELAAWFRAPDQPLLPDDLFRVMCHAWMLWMLDEEATLH